MRTRISSLNDLIDYLDASLAEDKAKLKEARRLARYVRDSELRKKRARTPPFKYFKSLEEARQFLLQQLKTKKKP